MILKVGAITFDDFYTLRYPVGKKENIIYPILKALKRQGLNLDNEAFLRQYFSEHKLYLKKRTETLRESLLDDVVASALSACGYEPKTIGRILAEAVDYGLRTKKAKWFPYVKRTLFTLRKKGYKLGLITNTHWRVSENLRREYTKFFNVTTLSYEHGYVKPHPSIFLSTLEKLGVNADHCLHVGDNPISDIQGPKSIGMKTAFVKRGYMKTDADIEIQRLLELTKFL